MIQRSHFALALAALMSSAVTIAAAQEKPKVAFVPQIVGIPYFDAMQEGGNKAAEALGVDFVYQGPVDTNPVDQLQIVQNLINQGVGAISVSVLDASSLTPVVEAAKAKDINLFTADSDAPQSGRALYVAQATDQGLGYAIVDQMVERAGEDAKIAIVSGEATASNLNAWIGFMQERVKEKYPNVTLMEPQYAGGSAERAAQIATDLMTANPDLKGIIGVASTTCPGVAQAIETAGRSEDVVGTGYCSPNTARSYLKSGALDYTVLWDPAELGYLTVWAGKQLIDGTEIPATVTPEGMSHAVTYDAATGILLLGDPAIFTAENVDDFNF
ncbi:autoinducer 2 ABC transporter substrate-binding protein [Aureimonas altamirensis]|uniref:autoinducer 2 ABC transporter substrate-binding protein n=1 Tax=Aureimonas altamirensis TaxID=370622 RepID=UPI00301AE703